MPFFQNEYCNPKRIKQELDQYVLEQDKGTRAIASAIAQHLIQAERGDQGQTNSCLLLGSTGSGKTETYRSLSRLERQIGVPIVMYNILDYASTKSWQGTPITTIFHDIFLRAGDIYYAKHDGSEPADAQKYEITKIANRAIVFLDEIDKIALQGDGRSRNFLMEYQSNLLKIIEGNTYDLDGFSHDRLNEKGEEETVNIDDVTIDTTHMLFILLGAFSGIECITLQRLETERQRKEIRQSPRHILYQDTSLGFLIEPRHHDDGPKKITYTYEQMIPSTDDIVQYGFLPSRACRTTAHPSRIPSPVTKSIGPHHAQCPYIRLPRVPAPFRANRRRASLRPCGTAGNRPHSRGTRYGSTGTDYRVLRITLGHMVRTCRRQPPCPRPVAG